MTGAVPFFTLYLSCQATLTALLLNRVTIGKHVLCHLTLSMLVMNRMLPVDKLTLVCLSLETSSFCSLACAALSRGYTVLKYRLNWENYKRHMEYYGGRCYGAAMQFWARNVDNRTLGRHRAIIRNGMSFTLLNSRGIRR